MIGDDDDVEAELLHLDGKPRPAKMVSSKPVEATAEPVAKKRERQPDPETGEMVLWYYVDRST